MTRIMTFAAMSLVLLSATAEPRCEAIMSVQGETASLLPVERKFKLVWHDEFDGDRLDAFSWGPLSEGVGKVSLG